MTELIVQGLRARLEQGMRPGSLPLSSAAGGLMPGVAWDKLEAAEGEGEVYR